MHGGGRGSARQPSNKSKLTFFQMILLTGFILPYAIGFAIGCIWQPLLSLYWIPTPAALEQIAMQGRRRDSRFPAVTALV